MTGVKGWLTDTWHRIYRIATHPTSLAAAYGMLSATLRGQNVFDSKMRAAWRIFSFVVQIVLWVVVLYLLTPFLASIQPTFFRTNPALSPSDFILLVTAGIVLAYTYETHKLREESVYQRRMSAASDLRVSMFNAYYRLPAAEETRTAMLFRFYSNDGANTITKVQLLSGFLGTPIGRCGPFDYIHGEERLHADYFLDDIQERIALLNALRLGSGELRAAVLATNGERFVYTFRAITDNWRESLAGRLHLNDQFILVKKEFLN